MDTCRETSEDATSAASLRLLILDDEAAVGRTLARLAARAGWQADHAATVPEFQSQLTARHPDAVMLDLNLGDQDGVEQLRFLHGAGFAGGIALMSGFDERVLDAAREIGLTLGLSIRGVILKPASFTEIEAMLDLLRRNRPHRPASIRTNDTESDEPLSPARIDRGLIDGEMELEFQPIIGARSGNVEDIEALIRWRHPQRGRVMPDAFIPVSEQDPGVIDRLTMWVVRTATEQSRHLHGTAPNGVAVNISARNLNSLEFPDHLQDLVAGIGWLPSALTLEVTESAATANPAISNDILARLRLKGFRLAMDDFGTGFSSLKALLNSPFSQIKIDKSFVGSMLTSRDARVIVKSVADLAQNMGLKTVAEGAETRAVVDQLLDFGVDSVQGYHISRPLPAAQLPGWLREWSSTGLRS